MHVSAISPTQAEALFAYAKQQGQNAQTSLYGSGDEGTIQLLDLPSALAFLYVARTFFFQ